jgi:tetratricopeptide (TPR) repeat protein
LIHRKADDPATTPAQRALDLVMIDARRAQAMAGAALAAAELYRDPAETAIAHRALGLAARELHDAAAAATHLRRAIRSAERAGLAVAAAEARMSHALVLDDLGRPAAALDEIDRARAELRGLRLARATMQRALILRRLGRDREALAGYRQALRAFRRYGDLLWQGRALTNRGVLHGYRGELGPAEADLRAAQRIYERLELPAAVAQVQHNIGFLAAQAGDVPTALMWYDRAHGYLQRTGSSAIGLLDRADLLLSSRLLPEARATVDEAIRACRAGRLDSLLGQARLLSARIELASGAPERAAVTAGQAKRSFQRQGRTMLAALARRVEATARVARGRGDRRNLRVLTETAAQLADGSWLTQAWEAWLDAALLALRLGDTGAAGAALSHVDTARHSGPAPVRARAWYARALLELGTGQLGAAKRSAAAGYREVETHRASLGATELGVRSSGDGVDLATLRLRLALDAGDQRAALSWLQRSRSAALWLPPASPSADPGIARRLVELRRISAELGAAPVDPARTRRLLRRQRVIEAEVRRRAWQVPSGHPGAATRLPDLAELAATLGERVLVELIALDERLHALLMVDGRVVHRALGAVAAATGELAALRFAVRRVVLRHGAAASRQAAADAVRHACARLDEMLLAPLADLLGDRALVLAPTGALHALPWPMLVACRDRSLSVVPSSALWWQAATRPPRDGAVVLVAGPAPEYAAAEVAAIQARLGEATVLSGSRARVAPVLSTLDGAGIAHIASHGIFRADNPLFSHLRMVDGPMTVYDLSALSRPPGLLVLSACDSGLSAVHPGDELQGLCAALLGLGSSAVVASLGPVDDLATRDLMVDFHDRLRAGHSPSEALAAAQARLAPEYATTGGSFVCLGAG